MISKSWDTYPAQFILVCRLNYFAYSVIFHLHFSSSKKTVLIQDITFIDNKNITRQRIQLFKPIMISYYEANVLNQLQEWKRIIIQSHLPSAIYTINSQKRRLIFVGIGSSYWAARISEFHYYSSYWN